MELVELYEFYLINPEKVGSIEAENLAKPSNSNKLQPTKIDSWLLDVLDSEPYNNISNPIQVKLEMYERYSEKMNSEIGAMHDERLLRASINSRIAEHAASLGREVNLKDMTYQNFPSFFIFHYLWWMRLSRQPLTSKVKVNDLYDLLNASIASYPSVWAGERSIIGTLRQIKGRAIPSTKSALKYLYQENRIDPDTFEKLNSLENGIGVSEVLLPDTQTLNFTEFSAYYNSMTS